ncbi:hypothetical protein MTP99_011922 [Tenebrio molitor]|nr:hypothetical protein MTP99_011922 [Tenebrio molitor]
MGSSTPPPSLPRTCAASECEFPAAEQDTTRDRRTDGYWFTRPSKEVTSSSQRKNLVENSKVAFNSGDLCRPLNHHVRAFIADRICS